MITYKEKNALLTIVFHDGKKVGAIKRENGRYFYQLRGSDKHGKKFETIDACKRNLEQK